MDIFKDIFNSLSTTGQYLYDDDCGYVPFIINRAFSYYEDTIIHSNIMNQYSNNLTEKQQYDFYFHSVKKRKRFSPWKKPEENELIKMVMESYNISYEKAKEVEDLLNNENAIEALKNHTFKGGISGKT